MNIRANKAVVREQARTVTGWGREKPFSIRSVTDALARLMAGDGGHVIAKVREGVYQAPQDSGEHHRETQ